MNLLSALTLTHSTSSDICKTLVGTSVSRLLQHTSVRQLSNRSNARLAVGVNEVKVLSDSDNKI